MSLRKYVVKKIILGLPTVLSVTIILFYIMYMLPGDPIKLIAGERVTPERLEELRRAWGLDKPFYVQYFYWLSHIIVGDLGISIVTKQPVSLLISQRIPYTLTLMGLALAITYISGTLMGLICALKKDSMLDHILSTIAIIFYSIPGFWLGIMLMLCFGFYLRLFPISGYEGLHSLILPSLALALPSAAAVLRLTRAEMIEVLSEDFIRTARAKGLTKRRILINHALRNALIPVVVMFFLDVPWIVGGAVVIETVFAIPGIGRLLYISILRQDYAVVEGVVLIITLLTVIFNTLGDVVIALLDPRVRIEVGE